LYLSKGKKTKGTGRGVVEKIYGESDAYSYRGRGNTGGLIQKKVALIDGSREDFNRGEEGKGSIMGITIGGSGH